MEDPAVVRDALANNLFSVPRNGDDKDNRDYEDKDDDEKYRNRNSKNLDLLRTDLEEAETVAPAPVLAPDMDLDRLKRELATFDLEGLRCSLAKGGMDAAELDALLRLIADGGGGRVQE